MGRSLLPPLQISRIYHDCRENGDGRVCDAIPQLAAAAPDSWGVSLCTVDGQRFSIGDVKEPFSIQAIRWKRGEKQGDPNQVWVALERVTMRRWYKKERVFNRCQVLGSRNQKSGSCRVGGEPQKWVTSPRVGLHTKSGSQTHSCKYPRVGHEPKSGS